MCMYIWPKFMQHKYNHYKVNSSVAFGIFTVLGNFSHISLQNILISPK